jgi:hypothetical protein
MESMRNNRVAVQSDKWYSERYYRESIDGIQ